MSLQPEERNTIPSLTVMVARTAFPKGNIYLRMRDEMGVMFKDEQFTHLYPQRGQPAEAPWRLALVTLMQFMEDLTDREAADAVRSRIDWKYALGLGLEDEGFDFSVLSEFRLRLLKGEAEEKLFNTLLDWCREKGYFKKGGKQRTDSTNIVAAVASLHRLELVGQALYHVLDLLAQVAPEWLQQQVRQEWYERYRHPISDYHMPKTETERQALAETIGKDGANLLRRLYSEDAPIFIRAIPAVDILRQIWLQNYYQEGESVVWRQEGNLPPGSVRICSPFDIESRSSSKRDSVFWLGYKVHLSETCEDDSPHLITHVETALATEQDFTALDRIHTAMAKKDLLPAQHAVDMGYVSAETLVDSRIKFGVDLLGPVRVDNSWQARDADAFDITQFQIDWDKEQVTCPMGKLSNTWFLSKSRFNKPIIQIHFRPKDCLPCPAREKCTHSSSSPRGLGLQPKELHLALQAARERQNNHSFWERYAIRSGIEGTIGLAVDKLGMRRTRYRGLDKTHMHNLLTATAINMKRILNWLEDVPRSHTRISHFAVLAPL
jgi:transposase